MWGWGHAGLAGCDGELGRTAVVGRVVLVAGGQAGQEVKRGPGRGGLAGWGWPGSGLHKARWRRRADGTPLFCRSSRLGSPRAAPGGQPPFESPRQNYYS